MIDEKWDSVFKERLKTRYDEMKWLYGELYNNNERAFDYFCTMLNEYYVNRPAFLKEWDEMRLNVPDWYKGNDILGMLMYTNAFAGNLKGVKSHIDYLEECGINYLHLMPLLQSPRGRSDGGYAVSDFRSVQPELGTMEDLADLSKECHSRGMSVCLDFVMNHTSEDHEWARKAKAGDAECQSRYFFFDNWNIPNEFEKTVPQVFPQTAPGNFTWCEQAGKVVMTTFYPYQWDLNYGNPTVFNDMTANMLFLCNNGVDIIRLDAVPYIWKRLGTNCRNLPEVHTLVRIMRMAAEIVCPGTLLLGEVVMEPSKVVPYFGTVDKPECHMLYNVTTMASTWHTVATRDVRLLRHQLDAVFSLPKQYTFLNYLRCHDDIGWGLDYDFLAQFGVDQVKHKKYLNDYLKGNYWGSDSRGELYNDDPRLGDARLCGTTASLCGIEAAEYERNGWKLEHAIRLDIMLHAFLLTQSGIPVLYSGDEIGQKNDYNYHNDPLKWDDSRYLHRGNLNWDEVAERKDADSRPGKIFDALHKLEKIRSEYELFESSADTWTLEPYNDHILGIGRYYHDQKLLALFNFSEDDQTAWINENEDYVNLMTGEPVTARNVQMPGHSFLWMYHFYGKPAAKPEEKPEKKPEEISETKPAAVKKVKSVKAEKAKAEAEKAAKAKAEAEKAKAEAEKEAKAKAEAEKAKAEAEKEAKAKAEAEKAKAEAEKAAKAKAEAEKAKAEAEKEAKAKAEAEKAKAEAEKEAKAKAEAEKAKAEAEKEAKAKAEAEKAKAEAEKAAKAKAEAEKAKAEAEKEAKAKAEAEKAKAEAEKAAKAKAEAEKAKAEAEKEAKAKAEAEKVKAEAAKSEKTKTEAGKAKKNPTAKTSGRTGKKAASGKGSKKK